MAENVRLEMWFLWGLAAALALISIFYWAAYLIEPDSWFASWPAYPLTAAALAVGIGAYVMQRRHRRSGFQTRLKP